MALFTKEYFKMTKQMVKVDLSMVMETFILVFGLMIKLMDMESIIILMEQFTREIGKMMCKTVMEMKNGPMDLNTKGYILAEKSKDRVNSNGLMDLYIMDSSIKTILRVLALILGLMVESTLEIG